MPNLRFDNFHESLTGEGNDGVDGNRLHGLSVGGDQSQAMALDGQLGWAHGGEGVDDTEPVATSRRHREDLEGRVGHEAGVGVPELALSVDQQRLGVLASVHGQSAGVSLGGVFVQPVADQHDVGGQIEVVQVTVGVPGRRLPDDDTPVETVHLLETRVRVPEVSSCVSCPLVTERVSLLDGTLGDEGDSVVVLGSTLPDSVPVKSGLHALHVVLDVDDNLVVLADLNTGTGDHSVGGEHSTLDTIGQHALAVTPHGVGGVGGTNLAGTGIGGKF